MLVARDQKQSFIKKLRQPSEDEQDRAEQLDRWMSLLW